MRDMAKMLRQIDDEALERPFNKAQFIRLLKENPC